MLPKHRLFQIFRRLTLILIIAALAIGFSGDPQVASAVPGSMPALGMVCTTSPTATFTLNTRTGYIGLPDGNVVYMWGYSASGGGFQHPSSVLCVNQGDTVTIVLNNTLSADVSIIFPGQDNVMANGALSQPVFNAGGELVSLAPVASANGGSVTYSFVANHPGTFIYQSGTEPAIQVNMGLFGALIVRPSNNVYDEQGNLVEAYAYADAETRYKPSTEYLIVMSEIDPMLHMAVEQGYMFNINNYTPRYWLYNGRAFPDTIAPNGAGWLPTQPYGSLVYIHPHSSEPGPAYNPYPALVRQLNVGTENYAHHPHGNHGRLIAHDGRLLQSPGGQDLSYEKFTISIGPGQTTDSLFTWEDVDLWSPSNPIPVTIPQLQDLVVGEFYSGSPYLGYKDTLPVGMQSLNQCGEYYHIAHNHALHQITAWGMVLSGHITFTRIDPPLPNDCP